MTTTDISTQTKTRGGRIVPVLLAIMVVTVTATFLYVRSSSSDTDAIRAQQETEAVNDEVAGCKTLYRAEIDTAAGDLEILNAEGLRAAFDERPTERSLQDVFNDSDAAITALIDANERYAVEGELSLSDVDQFLANCKAFREARR